ncbi:YdaU family protein [Lysobacter sp. GX 14042]|uniref:DUF1376 domain-containing protein n=1 Tax=Lysobacter sp. GX 14042 TaxID=2907155 RepID=UPI001F3FBC4E|nr:YdaU family protein [Lysobacter sp. GX 14042]
MNYFEHHIGDYAAATSHLTLLEDAVYSRLLRRYYLQECPLPADVKQVARLAGARTPDELEAVDAVLAEFFTLEDDGWHNKRADEEIARFVAKIESARENGKKGGRPPKAKPPSGGRKTEKTQPFPSGLQEETRPFCSGSENETQPKAHQAPDSRPQELASLAGAREPTAAGRACLLMRKAGCGGTNPSHPDLLAALEEGVTPEALAATAAEAIEAKKTRPFAWAITTARSRHAEGAAPITAGATHAGHSRLSAADRVQANIERSRRERGEFTVIEGTASRVAN